MSEQKRIRVRGIILIDGKLVSMYREFDDRKFYTFPGGGLEEDDASVEDGVKREIKEEFGIEVKVIRKQYENIVPGELAEYIYLCEYVSGEFGTGSGPEFSNDPAYADRDEYLPEIVDKNKIKDLPLIPQNLKEKIVKDIEEGKI